ncbi:uncharacterized protein LOC111700694 isoform X2 [Eurytemora carolleeae]|nr:uncharacterized protein LOC111700694 isoform X2 [Eurytemora carolleeae]|eukprot:XP_023327467.1 uncharacterized protein LOC111700694 isoform X2 [Eurytemora affinis]
MIASFPPVLMDEDERRRKYELEENEERLREEERMREKSEEKGSTKEGMYVLSNDMFDMNEVDVEDGRDNPLYIVSDNINGTRHNLIRAEEKEVDYAVQAKYRLEQDEPSLSNSPFNSTQQFISKKTGKNKNHVTWPELPTPPSKNKKREQLPPEPKCFPFFRWFLILIGMIMLISVLFIMGQLLVDWGQGRAGGFSHLTTASSADSATSSSLSSSTTASTSSTAEIQSEIQNIEQS